jgi:hypothetical protein
VVLFDLVLLWVLGFTQLASAARCRGGIDTFVDPPKSIRALKKLLFG